MFELSELEVVEALIGAFSWGVLLFELSELEVVEALIGIV